MSRQDKSFFGIAPVWAWIFPILPMGISMALYFGELQTPTFLLINRYTQLLPDTLWTWLTFLGNGWGVFALCFPLLLLAPRLLCAGLLASAIGGVVSVTFKTLLSLPRPASILSVEDFYRVGEPLLHRAMPSGHTLTAFSVAAGIYFALGRDRRSSIWWIFVLASLCGLSRNALGAHWFTDVLAGSAIGIWSGMIGAALVQYVPETQFAPDKIIPRLLALGGLGAIYVLLTQTLDSALNQSLQYACVLLVGITLVRFIQAQIPKVR